MDGKKPLRKLSKLELLELLADQEREIEALKQQLEEKEKLLAQRTLRLNQFGNIAQAALAVNEVFETAQKAADQYLESVKIGVEDRLQREGTFPYITDVKHEYGHSSMSDRKKKSADAEEDLEYSVDEILRSIYEYEVVDACAGSMTQPKKAPKARRERSK